jgi:hypothetical protein
MIVQLGILGMHSIEFVPIVIDRWLNSFGYKLCISSFVIRSVGYLKVDRLGSLRIGW